MPAATEDRLPYCRPWSSQLHTGCTSSLKHTGGFVQYNNTNAKRLIGLKHWVIILTFITIDAGRRVKQLTLILY